MKNSFIVVSSVLSLVVLLFTGYVIRREGSKNGPIDKQSRGKVYKSLNNLSEANFENQKVAFCSGVLNRVRPETKLSYYFRRQVLDSIVSLLEKERKGKSEFTRGTPDGIRIYFFPNNAAKRKFKLGLVSTMDNGPDSSAPSGRHHKDYYEHDDHSLFHMSGTSGELEEGSCRGGATLRNRCGKVNCDDENCGIDEGHRVIRRDGERMVAASGVAAINTNAVWFDYHTLKKLVKSPLSFTGLRIYFGRYGTTGPKNTKLLPELKNRDTFVLMTTRDITPTTGRNRDPIHIDQFKCDGNKNTWKSLLFVAAFNKGELCPSRCN